MRLDPVDLKLQAQAQQQAVDAAGRARKATSDEARYRGGGNRCCLCLGV